MSPITFGSLNYRIGKPKYKDIKILLDTGASKSIIRSDLVTKLRTKTDNKTIWDTAAGPMSTNKTVKAKFRLSEFDERKEITWKFHVTKSSLKYDMIIGRDILSEHGICIDFNSGYMHWNQTIAPLKSTDATISEAHVIDSAPVEDATNRMKEILDAKYEPADLDKVVESCTNLTKDEKKSLRLLLGRYEDIFDGKLGKWKDTYYDIELQPGVSPYHARAFPIPRIHERALRVEVDRLVKEGVLKEINRSEWAAPTFIIPKKDGTVRFISDFRELNKRIKRKPFPIPKIQEMLLKLEGFQYGTSLDLNMGYYHIELTPNSKRLCTIVLPWGKYEYQRLPMGLCNSPDIFQEKMSSLMAGLEFVRTYIDDLLIITKSDWADHITKLEKVFYRIKKAGLKVNAKKSFFGKTGLEYLGYWITRSGVMPVPKKIDAIKNIATPKTTRDVRKFVGMVNYYRDMWIRRSDTLAPLTKLCSKSAKFEWKEEQEKAFTTMKKILCRETILAYPDFSQPFIIHTDASHTQLGAVISQNNKPIAFYSRKLSDAQTRYTTTERELLAIVETLKEFRNILLGQQIIVYTDHKNLTCKSFNTERVLRWRLVLEEYGPELKYIKGEHNIVADALSRLDITREEDREPEQPISQAYMAEHFGLDKSDLPEDAYPLRYKTIAQYLEKDKELTLLKKNKDYQVTIFHGGGKEYKLLTKNGKIVIPKLLQQRAIDWYHLNLCHPGRVRTEETIRQHFTFPRLSQMVADTVKKCPTCQKTKRSYQKYGYLPVKVAESQPWEKVCVDLVGPYDIIPKTKSKKKKGKDKKELVLWAITMIDPATGWFEMREIKNKKAINVANIFEQAWLTRYPWPTEITYDQGNEFMGEFAEMIKHDYGIKKKPASVRNPQSNSILERIHATVGNMVRTFQVNELELDEENPWDGILTAVMFATRATFHTTLQATPAQLVFGRDSILNTKFEADWNIIRQRKQSMIAKNNERENQGRIKHTYKVGDKVLYKRDDKAKFQKDPWDGPYTLEEVFNNGTVRFKRGSLSDITNIRLIKPYYE